jgi:hypothetical protein
MIRSYLRASAISATIALAASFAMPALAASPSDWSAVPTKTVKLFYPGQSGLDWLLSPEHKRADKKVAAGDACVSCHEGEEQEIGNLIVAGKRLEPNPITGKNGVIDLAVQVAYDQENAYFRLQWKTNMDRPGQMHDYIRFDGEKWVFMGGPKSSDKVRSGKEPPLYEDRLAIMIDDGSVPNFAAQGCWLSCHSGMRDMGNEAGKDAVKAHAVFGDAGLKESDIRKYLPASRTDDMASWDKTKSPEEIAKIKAAGGFVDLMQWRAARSNPVDMADDGYVLEYRLSDGGKGPFSWNVDRKTMIPKYMFDASKVGMKSITVADIGDPTKPFAMIREENAVAYDANAGWKEGDVLPGRLLSRADAKDSAADNTDVKGSWQGGTWTVLFTRRLDTGHPEDDKILKIGNAYTFGFAVHDDNVTTRFHHVAFPLSIGFGAKGDIEATKVN